MSHQLASSYKFTEEGYFWNRINVATSEHIHLTSYSRMKVYLATQVYIRFLHKDTIIIIPMQVLSSTVAKGFEYFDDPETKETQRFCMMFDRFFDCLNVRSYSEGKKKRKPDLLPYRTIR